MTCPTRLSHAICRVFSAAGIIVLQGTGGAGLEERGGDGGEGGGKGGRRV